MIHQTQRQREYLAHRLREVANLAVGTLLVGQFLAGEFNWLWTVVGVGAWVGFYSWGMVLLKGEEEETE